MTPINNKKDLFSALRLGVSGSTPLSRVSKTGCNPKIIISRCTDQMLLKLGFRRWNTYSSEAKEKGTKSYLKPGEVHWLFPVGWYNSIPEGFEIISIGGVRKRFHRGKTDDDERFGLLSFGFVRKELKAEKEQAAKGFGAVPGDDYCR